MIGILNNIFCSAACPRLIEYMKNMYFSHKRGTLVNTPLKFFWLTEMEYRTIYRHSKWTASKSDPDSGFYVEDPGGCGRFRGCGGDGGGRIGRGD